MKTIKFLWYLFLIQFSCNFNYSQSNSHFIDTNKLWSVLHYPYMQYPRHTTHFLKIGNYITLNDTVYYKLLRSDDEEHTIWYDYGYIREDSTERVFYRINDNTEEGMIYYGNAKTGDTLAVIQRYNNSLVYSDYIISSVDSVFLAGERRERLKIHNGLEIWIEGIGAISGLIYNHACDINGESLVGGDDYSLLCFKQSDSLIYINPSFNDCYDIFTGSEEIYDIKCIRVFPNPVVNETLNINFPQIGDYIIEVFNITGELIETMKIFGQEHLDVSINSMKKGFYIIRVVDLHNNFLYHYNFIIP